jgi:hypothetical protein
MRNFLITLGLAIPEKYAMIAVFANVNMVARPASETSHQSPGRSPKLLRLKGRVTLQGAGAK